MGELSASAESYLNQGQRFVVAKVVAATTERFEVPAEDLSVFRTAENGASTFTVVYTAGSGIDLGDPERIRDQRRSWKDIYSEDSEDAFVIEVNGFKLDTRLSLTEAVYQVFISEAKARGVKPLPDSPELAYRNGTFRTDTWLTGEKPVDNPTVGQNKHAARSRAWVARVHGGRVSTFLTSTDHDYRIRRFRPAVRLGMISASQDFVDYF